MDLKLVSTFNTILKYTDDTSLLVPDNSSVTKQAKFCHISQSSNINKLCQYPNKKA